jgi:hypothetical protein
VRSTAIVVGIEVMLPNERTPRSTPSLIDPSRPATMRNGFVRLIGAAQRSPAVPIALSVAAIIVAACKGGGSSGY